jgi:hypothetical protein
MTSNVVAKPEEADIKGTEQEYGLEEKGVIRDEVAQEPQTPSESD